MKKIFFPVLVAAALHLGATPVDSLDARVIAQQYFNYLNPEKKSVAICKTMATHYRGVITRYTFVFGNNDFIIIAGDDAVVPVLAYSRQQSYLAEDFSPGFAWWMETEYDQWIYKQQVQKASNTGTLEEWNRIRQGRFSSKTGAGVAPMITSRWGQSRTNDYQCPGFNDKIPVTSTNCNCTHCTAGCVAVAMAQVMNYWRFPESNNGRTFDWCHMPDLLIKMDGPVERDAFAVECNAIAGLLVNCGARANLNYCVSGCATGSTIGQAGSAIQGPYGYSSEMQHRYRTLTTGWKNKLRSSLDGGMPVLYGGQSGTGGHAFVCDGYESENYFHFNWGWTGAYDGFFYITSNDGSPEIDYDALQEALFFIHPGSWTRPDCPVCNETLVVGNSLSSTPYSSWFPNVVWSGLSPFFNYIGAINPFIPANSSIVDENGTPRLQYNTISAETIYVDQVIIPDKVNVTMKAYEEIELNNFETAWGAEFFAEITTCNEESKSFNFSGVSPDLLVENVETPEPASTDGFSLWPNPANGSFKVEYFAEADENCLFVIMDLQGNELLKISKIQTEPGLYQAEINTGKFSVGVYFIELRNNRGNWMKKVVIAE